MPGDGEQKKKGGEEFRKLESALRGERRILKAMGRSRGGRGRERNRDASVR